MMARSFLGRARPAAVVLAACLALPAAARAEVPAAGGDLTALSLDQLLSIEVTSVSKHAQSLADSAAAVYVLSGDDIRRSGAHSIAEALRQVPGLEVAQLSAQQYAITARGFNATSADKLQVLLDGRSVYTPLTSSVFWDVLDTDLADIDRIEVIRGPGAALWGANAVNGVINIITRSARDTTGVAARAAGGNVQRAYGAARWGVDAGAGAVRLYAQGTEITSSARPDGQDAIDGMRLEQLGFRSDWDLPQAQSLTVSGDAYTGRERAAGVSGGHADTTMTGANLVGRWNGHGAGGSNWSLLGYYDGYARNIPGIYAETRNTYDLEFQQDFRLGAGNLLLYGLGYRNSHDDTAAPPVAIPFLPARLTLQNGNAFVQDQVELGPLSLTLGSKFEIGTYTRFEFEPSLRLGWRAGERLFVWSAVSRAVRTPNRLDEDVAIYCPPPNGFPGTCGPGLFRVGNQELRSTRLLAYETGLRWIPAAGLSIDLATFYNNYSKLRSTEKTPPPFGSFENGLVAHSYGGELSLAWKPWSWASLRPYYQLLRIDASATAGSTDLKSAAGLEGSDPKHGAGLLLGIEPAPGWQADLDLRYVDKLPALQVPDYAEMNLRLAWQPVPRLELALSGRNLLDSRHAEWGLPASRIEPRRAGMLEISWGVR
jgi:iron complex outermembrane receptor protein